MCKEPLVVSWLPVGHIPHGYRKQQVKTHEIQDSSLLWGLSVVKSLIGTETLNSEEGYVSIRPKPMQEDELLPLGEFLKAAEEGKFLLNQ